MVSAEKFRIPVEKLKKVCNFEDELDFCKTSLDVPPLDGVIGQERAVRAMHFGMSMDAIGYNLFVVGPPGTGKTNYVEAIVSQIAKNGDVPADWCYLNNFNDRGKPLAVSLPAGQGLCFQKDLEELIADLKAAIPKSFEGSDYERQKDNIIQSIQQKMEMSFRAINQEATEAEFKLEQTPKGFIFIPLRDGKSLSSEEYGKLSGQERRETDEKGRKLSKRMDETLHEGRILEKRAKEQIDELEKQIALYAAGPLIDKLKEEYREFPKIVEYLESVLKDVTKNHNIFKTTGSVPDPMPFFVPQEEVDPFGKYKVNLFVNNEKSEGAPVVIEPNPSYYNLFGKIEYKSQMLALSTDFMMVKSGAIHQANGGYLILQVKDVLTEPFAWETLKKVLKYRQAVMENMGGQYNFVPTATLRPEPIPLNVKVVLIGSPLYYLILTTDEDFQKLFKVKVDFDIEMPRTPENLRQYVSFIKSLCQRGNLKHFNKAGLARVIEYGSRLAGQQDKLSTRFNEVTEIVYEANTIAQTEGSEYVEAAHVDKAIKERKYRSNKLEEKIQEQILQRKILIDIEGAIVGQVNGLVVLQLGGYIFGHPTRITARTYIGRGGVINIERETDLSGNIHSKGILTLSGYLGGKLAQEKPLGLTAQVTFEQTYSGVDGDSASSAELYAILSSLSGVPLKQSLAVTGSVNQHGEIQPIGGVTEKIEGFFDICAAKGLTGEQGVLIPAQNVDNLMLKDEVLDAVREKRFHIYAVKTIEEGLELLSGVPAGEIGKDGKYARDSIFYLADQKLREFNRGLVPETQYFGRKMGRKAVLPRHGGIKRKR
ncbi:MAG: AAA family ATPase [Desulfitobacteriaceae bacterium]|nr:AAA family ATPase [Desulfitobacteriaceae bacterium]